MRPVRVLQLATAGPLYGAERWILALMRNLDPSRVTCELAVLDDTPGVTPPLLDAAREAGLRAHAVPAFGKLGLGGTGPLRRLLRDGRYDVLNTHGYKADITGLLAATGLPVRTVATPHGWSERADRKLAAFEALDRASFALFDAVVPLSPDLARGIEANRLARRKLHTIANGIDLSEIAEARSAPRPSASLHLPGNGPVIGYCGQLIARKDCETLLTAFARLPQQDAQLVLVGDGDRREALEALARDLGIGARTHFTGYTPERLGWMAGFDLFVLPSHREGIPRCLMEAMALELPVVASAIPGNTELVEHGATGLLFAPGDAGELASTLGALLAAPPSLRRDLARAGRERVEARHSGQAMARAYADLFERLSGEQSSPSSTAAPLASAAGTRSMR